MKRCNMLLMLSFAMLMIATCITGCDHNKKTGSPTTPETVALSDQEATPQLVSDQELLKLEATILGDVESESDVIVKAASCGGQYSAGNPYPCCSNGGNCTWWAWKRAKDVWGVNLPGWGNARTWAMYARNAGYRVSSTPAVNTIAVRQSGTYGHVAWVTKIIDSNRIQVSEMNCWGNYGPRTWTYYKSYFDGGFIYNKSSTVNLYTQYDNKDPIAMGCAGDAITVASSGIYRYGAYVGYVELRWSNKCGTNWARTTRTDGRTWEGMVTEVQRSNPARNVRYSASGNRYIYGNMVYARNIPARACGSIGASGWYCTAWK